MAGGGVTSATDRHGNTQFTPDEVRAGSEVARCYGSLVTALSRVVDNVVADIGHGNLLDEGTARYIVERGVWLTPKLVTYDTMASNNHADFLPPDNQPKN
ncbi:hypothetical protein DL764_003038 [Monosporascus ibericus]|uniref:Uncharacterized protein n=1 Tax=Monosporascus ibericus TaxID=155417 RepID=A0A4Q4TKN2_9PEZI|nr:hypothetical protein DL764_003038 [Monosporascus ibericus]